MRRQTMCLFYYLLHVVRLEVIRVNIVIKVVVRVIYDPVIFVIVFQIFILPTLRLT